MNNDRFSYRVWDGEKEAYAHEGYVVTQLGVVGTYDPFVGLIRKINCTIEQCVGQKDKNGKWIYKGDVVVEPNQYPYFDYADDVPHKSLNDTFGVIEHDAVPNYVGIVDWGDENAQFVIVLQCVNPSKSGISNGRCHYFNEDENLEIIGNIHDDQFRDFTKMVEGEPCD